MVSKWFPGWNSAFWQCFNIFFDENGQNSVISYLNLAIFYRFKNMNFHGILMAFWWNWTKRTLILSHSFSAGHHSAQNQYLRNCFIRWTVRFVRSTIAKWNLQVVNNKRIYKIIWNSKTCFIPIFDSIDHFRTSLSEVEDEMFDCGDEGWKLAGFWSF